VAGSANNGIRGRRKFSELHGCAKLGNNCLILTDYGKEAVLKLNLLTLKVSTILSAKGTSDGFYTRYSTSEGKISKPYFVEKVGKLKYAIANREDGVIRLLDNKIKHISTMYRSSSTPTLNVR